MAAVSLKPKKHITIEYDESANATEAASAPKIHFNFQQVARLPAPGDNVAICCQRLEKGTIIQHENRTFSLDCTILEGHRFALHYIAKGAALMSWDLPFGYAIRDIKPGEYVCNAQILAALALRKLDFELPAQPNFYDEIRKHVLDKKTFRANPQQQLYTEQKFFDGFVRPHGRGTGTRNFIILLGTTSRTAGFVRALEQKLLKEVSLSSFPNIDGIVAVTHTEGGSETTPHNAELLLRTLAGFSVHPNVGGALLCDMGTEPVNNKSVREWLSQSKTNGYALPDAMEYFTVSGDFQLDLAKAAEIVCEWLPKVNECQRTKVSASELKIALQCGGSDAFSGVSGNPLAAYVAKEVVRCGGIAQMAETDELIGAEPYFISNVKDYETAEKFLAQVERFKERAARHGHSAEGNPSGGNKLRGLYNICLKSLGAAMKRNPDVRLDYVIEYSELMRQPGFYFMDSPGNDLESIAGQVASGSNMIYFITGNGSITNFPFVPTIKIVTTTTRFKLLEKDMDVNAGRYLDGVPMAALGDEVLDLTLKAASGKRTAGEKAGHAQVQIWRNWTLEKPVDLATLKGFEAQLRSGNALKAVAATDADTNPLSKSTFEGVATPLAGKFASDQIGMILPTSVCSGQIAALIANKLNDELQHTPQIQGKISRYVALPHTEGCGSSGGDSESIFSRTLIGYLLHPTVKHAVLLEHGCEKTHNNYFSEQLSQLGVNETEQKERFGWASVQLDGGIDAVTHKVQEHFHKDSVALSRHTVHLDSLRLALLAPHTVPDHAATLLADITTAIVSVGGLVVIPQNQNGLLKNATFMKRVIEHQLVEPSLSYGQRPPAGGLHIMQTPTDHWVETLTGLGATGVELMLAYVDKEHPPFPTHPMIPLLQVTSTDSRYPTKDFDFVIGENAPAEKLLKPLLGRENVI